MAMMVLLPVPFMPTTNQLSSMLSSGHGEYKPKPGSISSPALIHHRNAHRPPQSAWRAARWPQGPFAGGRYSRLQPCGFLASGAKHPGNMGPPGWRPRYHPATGPKPKPANQAQTFKKRGKPRALEPQPLAISRENVRSWCVNPSSSPAINAWGTITLYSPAA